MVTYFLAGRFRLPKAPKLVVAHSPPTTAHTVLHASRSKNELSFDVQLLTATHDSPEGPEACAMKGSDT